MKQINKKNIITGVILVVIIALFSIASFAFLGSFKKQLNNVDVNIIAENVNNTYFNVTNNVSFALDVDPSMMSEASSGTYVAENTATLDVSINPALNGLSVKCTYDIIFEYDSSSNIYGVSPTPATSGADKELTLQIVGPNGTSDYFEEKNFNLTSRSKTVVSRAEIINSISGMPTAHRWKFINRFYNLDLDQSELANKSFKGRYYVANVSCDKYEDNTIYSLIKNRYKNNDTYVKLYNEEDASSYANPVYYFNGAVTNNNVLFGGFCWKMVRTTDTGGIKMIYNGVQKEIVDTVTLNESDYTISSNDSSYPFTFNSETSVWENANTENYSSGTVKFSVNSAGNYYLSFSKTSAGAGDYISIKKNNTNVTSILYGNNGNDTSGNPIEDIYLENITTSDVIEIFYGRDQGTVTNIRFNMKRSTGSSYKTCNNSGTTSQLVSTKAFNSNYDSLAYVGYMHNTIYPYSTKSIINSNSFSGSKMVGDSVTYGSTYTLNNTSTVSVSSSNISSVVGKYTCNSSSSTSCSNPWYIVGYSGKTIYYYQLSGGNTDGTSYSKNLVFGNSFTYANNTYTLQNTTAISSDTWISNISSNKTSINTHHYTCFAEGTTCTSLYYVYDISGNKPYFITLTNGKSVDNAINEMLYADDVNKNDSTMKAYIDSWYKEKMTSYTDKLEDTIFCNDRTMSNQSSNGWNPNGGSTTTYLQFKNYSANYSLACTNETDRFSVNNNKAKLTYPVGLLSLSEAALAMRNASAHYLTSGNWYWLASPFRFNGIYADGRVVDSTGYLSYYDVYVAGGVRPAVSLKPGTEYTSGDGSYTNPFVVN